MDDDELALLRMAALKTLNKKSDPSNGSTRPFALKPSPDRSPRASRYPPRPTTGASNNWHNNFSNHARGFSHNAAPPNFSRSYRSNLVVLQGHSEPRSQSPRKPAYNDRRPPLMNGMKKTSSSPEEKRVLPGRFARLNDDSSDSDADYRLEESESECELESKPHSFAEESSASNFDFAAKDMMPDLTEPDLSDHNSNDSDMLNDRENKTSNGIDAEVKFETRSLSPIQDLASKTKAVSTDHNVLII